MIVRILSAIWNGPFHVGTLVQPITLGSALMKVLEVAWRATLIIFVCLAVLLLGALWQDRLNDQRVARVQVQAAISFENCPETAPLWVEVFNENTFAIDGPTVYLSTVGLTAWGAPIYFPRSVEAGQTSVACFPIRTDVETVGIGSLRTRVYSVQRASPD